MPTDARSLPLRFREEVCSRGNLEVADEIFAADYVNHDPVDSWDPPGPEGVKRLFAAYRTAFPDLEYAIEDVIVAGDRVVTRWKAWGTHTGDLMGIPPTSRRAECDGITIDRVADGRIVESWVTWNTLGFFQQLGLLPDLSDLQPPATPGRSGG
jgi:steroid delta-isomerase-like uncharacterized protein